MIKELRTIYSYETDEKFYDAETGVTGNFGITDDIKKAKRIGNHKIASIDDLVFCASAGLEPLEGLIQVQEGIVEWQEHRYISEWEEEEIIDGYFIIQTA